MSGPRPRNRPSMGWLRAGHATPLRCEGNEVSDNLFRIGCLQNRDRARTRTDRVTGTLTLTNGTVLNLDAADLMRRVADAGQPVRHGGGAFGCAYLGRRRSTCAPT